MRWSAAAVRVETGCVIKPGPARKRCKSELAGPVERRGSRTPPRMRVATVYHFRRRASTRHCAGPAGLGFEGAKSVPVLGGIISVDVQDARDFFATLPGQS